jgi:hypothetical protein
MMSEVGGGCVKTRAEARYGGFRADRRKIAANEFNDLEELRNPRPAVKDAKIDLKPSFHAASVERRHRDVREYRRFYQCQLCSAMGRLEGECRTDPGVALS